MVSRVCDELYAAVAESDAESYAVGRVLVSGVLAVLCDDRLYTIEQTELHISGLHLRQRIFSKLYLFSFLI